MSHYPKETYVMFYDHEDHKENKWSCSAIYALCCEDDGFILRERNPITSKLKDVVKTIAYHDIQKMKMTFDFNIPRIGVPIKHIYEVDPSGAFFEADTTISIQLNLWDGDSNTFYIGAQSFTLPILLRIIEEHHIELDVDQDIVNDMKTLSSEELYHKYILAHLDYKPFIIKENKNHW